jgi:hypothetical protein
MSNGYCEGYLGLVIRWRGLFAFVGTMSKISAFVIRRPTFPCGRRHNWPVILGVAGFFHSSPTTESPPVVRSPLLQPTLVDGGFGGAMPFRSIVAEPLELAKLAGAYDAAWLGVKGREQWRGTASLRRS